MGMRTALLMGNSTTAVEARLQDGLERSGRDGVCTIFAPSEAAADIRAAVREQRGGHERDAARKVIAFDGKARAGIDE